MQVHTSTRTSARYPMSKRESSWVVKHGMIKGSANSKQDTQSQWISTLGFTQDTHSTNSSNSSSCSMRSNSSGYQPLLAVESMDFRGGFVRDVFCLSVQSAKTTLQLPSQESRKNFLSYIFLYFGYISSEGTLQISVTFLILSGVFYRFEVSCPMFIATFMGPFQMTALRRSGIVKCHGRNSCLRTCKYRPHFTVRQGGTHVKLNVRVVNFPFWPHASVLDGWNAMGLTQESRR